MNGIHDAVIIGSAAPCGHIAGAPAAGKATCRARSACVIEVSFHWAFIPSKCYAREWSQTAPSQQRSKRTVP